MDELFMLIGKLYVDLVQSQRYIETLQKQLQEKNSANDFTSENK